MANTKDQMQDVFPIVFNFVKGELPTAEKLTGLVKHTDSAFSRITQGIGDPWDYTLHDDGTGSRLNLSLENLGQSSLARVIGSSDYLSPMGGCWNESMTSTKYITLRSDRNSWVVGYPLVRVTTPITEQNSTSVVTPLTWNTDIGVSGIDHTGVFTGSPKASADLVQVHGDFFIDFYKGVIITYSSPPSNISLYVRNWNMFGVGVPWGTHNVIPSWNQSTLCNCSKDFDTATTSTYTITLPLGGVEGSPRMATSTISYGKKSVDVSSLADVTWGMYHSGLESLYRLPAALTQSNLSSGDVIPEGYLLLWDGDRTGQLVTQVTFYYLDENSVTVVTPLDWLDEGDNYRLITSGTSTADALSYLMAAVRNNEHVGLIDSPSLSYTVPLSHNNLENRYSGDLTSTLTDAIRWKFRESSYPTNTHPQYIHRGGYMTNDDNGNDGNTMRGTFVLGGDINTSFTYGEGTTLSQLYQSQAVAWGGGNTTKNSITNNAFMRVEGTYNATTYETWSSGNRAVRIPFGLDYTGSQNSYSTFDDENTLGALSLYSWYGIPLYLRGFYANGTSDTIEKKNGAVLGFDLGQRTEANYIRLMDAVRDGTYDATYMPAQVSGMTASTRLNMMPSLSSITGFKRISADQVREFRFRAIPWVDNSTNTTDGLGGTNIRGAGSDIDEFKEYFVSPAIVGADFLNVYGNAIFFSDTGDGKRTSFTQYGSNWLNSGSTTYIPTGIYYVPYSSSAPTVSAPYFSFQLVDTDNAASYYANALTVGNYHGLRYAGEGSISLNSVAGSTSLIAANNASISTGNDISLNAGSEMDFTSISNMSIISGGYLYINVSTYVDIDATTYISIHSSTTSTLSADSDVTVGSNSGHLYLEFEQTVNGLYSNSLADQSGASIGVNHKALYIDTSTGQIVHAI